MCGVSIHAATPLRFTTAGSVDDGKSTLIGRLLWDSKGLLSDQVTALEAGSRRAGQMPIDFRSSPTDSWPSANRASRSTSHTVTSRRRRANSSSAILRVTSSTHATWSLPPAPQM